MASIKPVKYVFVFGGVLSGLLFDIFGDYTLAYWVAAFLVLFSIVAQWAGKIVEPKRIVA